MAVMDDLDRLRGDALDLLPRLLAEFGRDIPPALRAALEAQHQRLAQGCYNLVACGEFRRGKSSLLNALVDRPGLFPVNVDITTSAVTTLSWAAQEQAFVHFVADPNDPGSARPPLEVPIDQVARYVTEQGNPGNAEQVALVEMTAAIDCLKSGLVLVDTPGLGGLNPAHAAATWAFLGKADAILFVASAVEPIGTLELEDLTRALDKCETVITAVTMIDKAIDPGTVVDAARERIADHTGRSPDELIVIGVSALRKHNAIRAHDDGLLEASGFPSIERELWSGLAATCGVNQINESLDGYEELLEVVAAPRQNTLAGLLDGSTLSHLDAELRARREEIQKLRASGHRWRRDLAADLDAAKRPIRTQLNGELDGIRDRFRKSLNAESSFPEPAAIIRQVSLDLVEAAERANQALADAVDKAAATYTTLTSCSLTGSGAAATTVRGDPRSNPVIVVHGAPSRFRATRNVWFGGGAGYAVAGTTGAIIGTWVFPVIGTFVGALVGGTIGLIFGASAGVRETNRLTDENRRREYVNALRDKIVPLIESARRQAEQDLADQVRDETRSLTAALEDHLTTQEEALTQSLDGLVSVRRTTERERPARITALTAELNRCAEFQAEVDTLRGRTYDLASRSEG